MSRTDEDLEEGVRFLHKMGMQTKIDGADTAARLHGLIEELVARGLIPLRSLEERTERARKEEIERGKTQAVVEVGPPVDKYTVEVPPIDCQTLLPLCKARCCRLTFSLSFQDLDEGGIQWEYGKPYNIRHDEDGMCVHHVRDQGCSVYAKRPAVCRSYDCRQDKRVWDDYEKRIPAPEERIPLVTLRKRPQKNA
jgi:hypothetical protein